MTNIEKLAQDICNMKNRDKILQALPEFLFMREIAAATQGDEEEGESE